MSRWLLAFLLVLFLPVFANADGVFTILNYPRYGTALDATQSEELRRFAKAIVGALTAGRDVSVSVYGHADFDAKGRDFETQVSRDRAAAAEAELRNLLSEEAAKAALPAARMLGVQLVVFGNGTLNPVFRHPSGPDEQKQRMANRRVEFVWSVATLPAPVKQTVFDRCRSAIASGAAPGPTRRMTCACSKLQQPTPRVKDFTYDFKASRSIPGSAGLPQNLTPEQWDAAMRALIVHLRPEIQRTSNSSASDRDFKDALVAIDDKVGRSIDEFQMQEAGGAAQGAFDKIVLTAIREHMADPNHVYSCY